MLAMMLCCMVATADCVLACGAKAQALHANVGPEPTAQQQGSGHFPAKGAGGRKSSSCAFMLQAGDKLVQRLQDGQRTASVHLQHTCVITTALFSHASCSIVVALWPLHMPPTCMTCRSFARFGQSLTRSFGRSIGSPVGAKSPVPGCYMDAAAAAAATDTHTGNTVHSGSTELTSTRAFISVPLRNQQRYSVASVGRPCRC